MTTPSHQAPIRSGVLLASAAAALFGVVSPLVQAASAGAGAIASSALLYLGAAAVSLVVVAAARHRHGVSLRRAAAWRVLAVALLGGALAPSLLVLGLSRTDAASASLLLALEAPFTILLARLFYREQLERRALAGAALITAAGLILVGGRAGSSASVVGGLLVSAAALDWAVDNLLLRGLSEHDTAELVTAKGAIGGGAAALVAWGAGQAWPSPSSALALVVVGGLGFGWSLQLYLRAQRRIGVARTASIFSAAPFVGALAALLSGRAAPDAVLGVASLAMLAGLWLHATERHHHWHEHGEQEHEHLHSHDDGHHHHPHDPLPARPHSHPHRHDAVSHSHEHADDLHHRGHHRPADGKRR